MKQNKPHKNAFTLIELLVVIAIIAMLMSILLPSLAAVKDQSRRVVCMTHLSQWNILLGLYAEDNGDFFFTGYYRYTDPNGTTVQSRNSDLWPYVMQQYNETSGLRFCPSDRKSPREKNSDDILSGSYGLNGWICNPPEEIAENDGHKTQNNWRQLYVKSNRSNIPLMADAYWFTGLPEDIDLPAEYDNYPSGSDWANQPDNQMRRFCVDRHRGTLNVLFLDGGISAISPKALWRLKWHKAFDTAKPLPEWPEWMQTFKKPD